MHKKPIFIKHDIRLLDYNTPPTFAQLNKNRAPEIVEPRSDAIPVPEPLSHPTKKDQALEVQSVEPKIPTSRGETVNNNDMGFQGLVSKYFKSQVVKEKDRESVNKLDFDQQTNILRHAALATMFESVSRKSKTKEMVFPPESSGGISSQSTRKGLVDDYKEKPPAEKMDQEKKDNFVPLTKIQPWDNHGNKPKEMVFTNPDRIFFSNVSPAFLPSPTPKETVPLFEEKLAAEVENDDSPKDEAMQDVINQLSQSAVKKP